MTNPDVKDPIAGSDSTLFNHPYNTQKRESNEGIERLNSIFQDIVAHSKDNLTLHSKKPNYLEQAQTIFNDLNSDLAKSNQLNSPLADEARQILTAIYQYELRIRFRSAFAAAALVNPEQITAIETIKKELYAALCQENEHKAYLDCLDEYSKSDANKNLSSLFITLKEDYCHWLENNLKIQSCEKNKKLLLPAATVLLTLINQEIIRKLTEYENDREHGGKRKKYAMRDFFSSIFSTIIYGKHDKEARLDAAFTIKKKFGEFKDVSDYLNPSNQGILYKLTSIHDDIDDEDSRLKNLLSSSPDTIASTLARLDKDSDQAMMAASIVNKSFNQKLIKNLEEYKTARSSNSFLRSIIKIGLFKTIKEKFFRDVKDLRIDQTKICINKLKKCEKSKDYKDLILYALNIIGQINQQTTLESYSGLRTQLETMINMIVKRFVFDGHLPEFDEQQKFTIACAVKGIYNTDINLLTKRLNLLNLNTDKNSLEEIAKENIDSVKKRITRKFAKKIEYGKEIKPNLFERAFQIKLCARLNANIMLSGGDLLGTPSSLETAAVATTKVGKLVSSIASLGAAAPAISAITATISFILTNEGKNQRNLQYNNIASTFVVKQGSKMNLDKFIFTVAEILRNRYALRIQNLRDSQDGMNDISLLADCAVAKIIDYIKQNPHDGNLNEEFATELADAVITHDLSLGITPFTNKGIPHRTISTHAQARDIIVENFFAAPYFAVEDKGKYTYYLPERNLDDSKKAVNTYGYIRLTSEEFNKLQETRQLKIITLAEINETNAISTITDLNFFNSSKLDPNLDSTYQSPTVGDVASSLAAAGVTTSYSPGLAE